MSFTQWEDYFSQGCYSLFSLSPHEPGYALQLHNTKSDQASVVSRAKPEWGVAVVLC